jgi:hypothetical protein
MTWVNTLKKKSVAFGLSALVKNPVRKALRKFSRKEEIFFVLSILSNFIFFLNSLKPETPR